MKKVSYCQIKQLFVFAAHLKLRTTVFTLPILLIAALGAAFGEQGDRILARKHILTVINNTWPKEALELVEVKNLQATEFPKGFGIVVKNISSKPIYFISVSVQFLGTEPFTRDGNFAAMSLFCGPTRLTPAYSKPEAWDVPLMPGEIATLKIDDKSASRFFHWIDPNSRQQQFKKRLHIRLNAQKISFGDGTGYLAGKYYAITPSTTVSPTTDDECWRRGASCFGSDSQSTQCCLCGDCISVTTVGQGGGMPCQNQNGSYSPICSECWDVAFGECGPIVRKRF